jgi:hypothetical protein
LELPKEGLLPGRINVTVNDQLLDVAERLTTEYPELPAGSVLRSFARAVVLARRSGCPTSSLPHRAERMTRHLLAKRGYPALVDR